LPQDRRDRYYDKRHPAHDVRVREGFSGFERAFPEPHDDATPPGEPGKPDLATALGAIDPPDPPAPFTLEAPPGKVAAHYPEDVRQDIAAVAHSAGFPPALVQETINAVATGHEVPVPQFAPYGGSREAAEAQLRRRGGRTSKSGSTWPRAWPRGSVGSTPSAPRTNPATWPSFAGSRGWARTWRPGKCGVTRRPDGIATSTPQTRRAAARQPRALRWTTYGSGRRG
jgi:hypothetical protein